MSTSSITIQQVLPAHLRAEAARLYADAFQRKLGPVLGPRPILEGILQSAMYAPNAIVALREGGLVGLAGVQHQQKHFINVGWQHLREAHGVFGAGWRAGLALILERPHQDGELLMDGIAVDAAARGQGFGSLLLNAVCDFARSYGYSRIRLDVIDTNPDARRLYERHGFQVSRTQSLGLFRHIFGFGSAAEMVKTLI